MSSSGNRNRRNPLKQEIQSSPETRQPFASSAVSPEDVNPSCSHLSDVRSRSSRDLFHRFRESIRLHPLGRAYVHSGDDVRCGVCLLVPHQLYACLSCAAVACRAHFLRHAEETSHLLGVDVSRAELFCCACGDQVYDRDFDAVVVEVAVSDGRAPLPETARKRRRVEYKPWSPDRNERALIDGNSSPLPAIQPGSEDHVPWGLRGLNNLGNTCFMNSVLQALLHTPPLRNFFLSDKHNRFYCERENRTIVTRNSEISYTDNTKAKLCLACDLDAIFSAVFSGDRMPYSPAKFLFSWWQHASNLASYEQQDAHEFFISMLDGIHEKLHKDRRKPHFQGNGDCCIAHRVFSGILRSDVMCTSCGFTSTTYDPCVDISLDLEPHRLSGSPKLTAATLAGCLDRFTRPERLGSDQKFFCQRCQVRQESLKQMSIRKLPLVTCFHIKRFEHSSVRKMSRKIDRYLQFPMSLHMEPYLSSTILRSRNGNRMTFPFESDESDCSSSSCSEFELFAVIAHSGKLDSGHYVTYLRLGNQWYKCDDAWITRVNDDSLRGAQAYMLFYVQKMLFYRAAEG